jgi:hypothetical protein
METLEAEGKVLEEERWNKEARRVLAGTKFI